MVLFENQNFIYKLVSPATTMNILDNSFNKIETVGAVFTALCLLGKEILFMYNIALISKYLVFLHDDFLLF